MAFIDDKMADAINKQINAELYSSYMYLSMSAYFEGESLVGMAQWMKVQAQEEVVHAIKFYEYVIERGGRVILTGIEDPPTDWKSPLEVFEKTLIHEQKVTCLINNLVDIANDLKDHATTSMLKWFVDEQVEEEASADEIVQKLKQMKDVPGGIYMLDKELGSRPTIFPVVNASEGE